MEGIHLQFDSNANRSATVLSAPAIHRANLKRVVTVIRTPMKSIYRAEVLASFHNAAASIRFAFMKAGRVARRIVTPAVGSLFEG